jgi:hypothetical protein
MYHSNENQEFFALVQLHKQLMYKHEGTEKHRRNKETIVSIDRIVLGLVRHNV